MKKLGLTGDIACGKSTVAAFLKQLGAHILDSDLIVRELYADTDFAARLKPDFGDVLEENGGVSRVKLGALVFNNPEKLRALETIVHPAVAALRARKFAQLESQNCAVVVIEAVKLLESGQGRVCDEIWCVVANSATQTRRLMENRGLSAQQAAIRLRAQPSRADKIKLAAPIPLRFLENDGTLADLEEKTRDLWTNFSQT